MSTVLALTVDIEERTNTGCRTISQPDNLAVMCLLLLAPITYYRMHPIIMPLLPFLHKYRLINLGI